MAKMLPDSRMPRRLPSVMRTTNSTRERDGVRQRVPGIADPICATADEIDTATVRT